MTGWYKHMHLFFCRLPGPKGSDTPWQPAGLAPRHWSPMPPSKKRIKLFGYTVVCSHCYLLLLEATAKIRLDIFSTLLRHRMRSTSGKIETKLSSWSLKELPNRSNNDNSLRSRLLFSLPATWAVIFVEINKDPPNETSKGCFLRPYSGKGVSRPPLRLGRDSQAEEWEKRKVPGVPGWEPAGWGSRRQPSRSGASHVIG